jgi:photosystem II stability/assembly factor-like uncharacterized protein
VRLGFGGVGAAAALCLATGIAITHEGGQGSEITRSSYRFHHVPFVGGGFITGILFHPSVKGLAYCRTDIGGAYRWDEAERRWTSLSEWIPMADANLIGVEGMALDVAHPDDLYLAAGTYTHDNSPNGALLRSHDRGKSFETIALPFKLGANEEGRFAGERLVIDPAHAGTLYFGTRLDGLWRSMDSGSTWARVSSFPGHTDNGVGITFVLFGPKKDGSAGAIYAGVSSAADNLFVSEDTGASWQMLNGAPRGLMPNHAVSDSDGDVYVTYGNKSGPNGMTAGAVWRRSKEGAWKDITPEMGGAGGGYGGLALDPEHEGTVVVSTMDRWKPGDTLYQTNNGGKYWVSMREKAKMDPAASPWLRNESGVVGMGHWIGAVAIDPFDSDHMLYGTGETIWATHNAHRADHGRSTDWVVGAEGIEETAVISIESPASGAKLFTGLGDIGCFRIEDAGPVVLGPPRLANCDSVRVAALAPESVVMSGRVWTGASHGGYSEDGGKTWKPFVSEPLGADKGGRVEVSADGRSMVWTTSEGAFGSRDKGLSWQQLAEGGKLEVVADRSAAGNFFVMDQSRGVLSLLAIGSGMRQIQDGLEWGLHLVAGAAEGEVWMYGPTGVWRERGPELTKLGSVRAAYALGLGRAMVDGGPETLYLSGDVHGTKGVYRSSEAGKTWVRIDDKEHEYGVVAPISGDPRVAGRVYLGTNGFGVVVGDPE